MKNSSLAWTLVAAGIAAVGVAIHLGAIVGGESWYAFFGAPPSIVASARQGTWLAPASAAVIAVLMGVCALYACSAAGLVRRLPLLRLALAGIATVCLVRGAVLIPFAIKHPQLFNTFEVVAAIVWAIAGIGFAVAFRNARARPPAGSDARTANAPALRAPTGQPE